MVALVAPTRVNHQNTPQRWARALDRALHGGVEIYTTHDGERFATSSSRHDLLYAVTPETCDCQAGLSGDPVCCHRAALRSILGTQPVTIVRVDELVPPDAPRCNVCFGRGERWAGSVDDECNPQRWITCPDCCGTGRDIAAMLPRIGA